MARRLIEEEEVNVIVLCDRGVNKEFAPIPALLAVAGLHHYLIREGLRTRVEPRARDRRAARGASLLAAHRLRLQRDQSVPRLRDARRHDPRGPADRRRPQDRLQELRQGRDRRAWSRSPRRWASRPCRAIAARRSSRRVGLRQDVIDKYFTWTPSRVGGVGTGRDRAGSAGAAPRARSRSAPVERPRAAGRRPVPVARRRRVPPVQSGDDPQAAEGGAHRAATRPSRSIRALVNDQATQPLHAARPARLQGRRRRCRSRRSSRSRAS